MTDISNRNKKAKFLDLLCLSIWPNLPQALVSKMSAKKREPWRPKEHSQAFQCNLCRELLGLQNLVKKLGIFWGVGRGLSLEKFLASLPWSFWDPAASKETVLGLPWGSSGLDFELPMQGSIPDQGTKCRMLRLKIRPATMESEDPKCSRINIL